MKLTKYFGLLLVMFAGQSMASPYYGNGHGYGYGHGYNKYGSKLQIRRAAQRLIFAERNLLRTINRSGSAYSHAARDVRGLISKTIQLKNSTYYRTNKYRMQAKMRNIRIQFRHMRSVIARTHRLRHSRLVMIKVRNMAYKIRRLSRTVNFYRGYPRVVRW